jgi:hypothetical protein
MINSATTTTHQRSSATYERPLSIAHDPCPFEVLQTDRHVIANALVDGLGYQVVFGVP